MRSLIPGCLAAVCAVAVLAGPAEAQRGRQGGGSYNRGYSGYNYGNYRGNNYGNNYGYYRGNNYGYYGGNSFGISVGNQGYYNGYGYRSYPSYSYYGGYNTPQYGYGYNATPYYVTPGTSDAIAYNSVPSQSAVTTSNYGDPLDNAQAWLRVILPDPNSRLTIEGQLMQQTGTERVFYTPRLDRGAIYP